MSNENWQEAADAKDVKEGTPVAVKVGKRTVLLVRLDGKVYAMGAKCPHYGAPLEKGVLIDHVLSCPWHTARFDVTRGTVTSPPALDDPPGYEAREEQGKILIRKRAREAGSFSVTEDTHIVILGGGAAGCSAALGLREADFTGKITMVTAEKDLPYDRPALSKGYLDGSEDPKWLPLKDAEYYENMAIEVMTERKADSLDTKNHTIHLTDGSSLSYDRLLLATGSTPRTPPIEGTGLDRFFLLRSYGDARRIVDSLQKAKSAVVIGASFIGLEVAAALRARDIQAQVVAPEETPMEKVFGDRIGRFLQGLHEDNGVRFSLGVMPREVREGKNGRIEVRAGDGTVAEGDLVIAGVGVSPAVDYLEGTGLVEKGAVAVDESLRTKAEDVWAAGDIALLPDFITGSTRRVEHWVEAQRQGRHAALSMLGSRDPYREVPFFWTKQYDASIKYLGYGAGYEDIRYRGEVGKGSFMAGYYRGDKLLAAAALGMTEDIIVTGELIKIGEPPTPARFEDAGTPLREIFGR